MDPNNTNPPTPPADPPAEEQTPAWAQQLIDTNTDLASRLGVIEESFTAAVDEPEPAPPEYPEPWKPQSWEDVDSRAEEKARTIVESTFAEREAAAQQAATEQQQAATEIDQYLDGQVDELTKANALPPITNPNDPNDPGKLAQRELYGYALSLGTADLKASHSSLDALHKAGKSFDFVKMELVDSNPASLRASVPVGSSNAGASGTTGGIDYATLHNNSIDALAARFSQ